MRTNRILPNSPLRMVFQGLLICGFLVATSGCGSSSRPASSPTPDPNRAVKVFSVAPSTVSAAGGQTVTINGEGFLNRSTVQILFPGGLDNGRVISDTQIQGTTVPTNFSSNPFRSAIVVIADGISSADHSPGQVMVSVQK